jgi:UDP-N-acetyl-D-mannosaminuronate dehydrogenase
MTPLPWPTVSSSTFSATNFKETLGNCREGHAEIAALEDSLKIIGEKINPDCLVLIETTVPPGTPNTWPIPY